MLIRLRDIDKTAVEALVIKRNEARDEKNWAEADKFRDELENLGIELFDGKSRGWRVKTQES